MAQLSNGVNLTAASDIWNEMTEVDFQNGRRKEDDKTVCICPKCTKQFEPNEDVQFRSGVRFACPLCGTCLVVFTRVYLRDFSVCLE